MTAIPLTAVALAQAIATGELTLPILLAGNAAAAATATGNLIAYIPRPVPDASYTALATARLYGASALPRRHVAVAAARRYEVMW